MHNNKYKYRVLLSLVAFLFFSFSSFVLAVNYGAGLYGDGIYSATPPGTPTAFPAAGLYNATQLVTLTESGSTSIRYSVTGTPATCSSDIEYLVPISVSSTQTIYVRACDVYGNSSIASFTYTIDTTPPENPTAIPTAGLFNSTQSVTLSATGSDFIEYDLSSLPADCSSGTSYRGSIPVSSSQTIYVRACDNAGNSSTESFTYTIDTTEPLTPVATPSSGIYNSTQSVTLTATDSDYIKYATDDFPATCSDGTLYSGLTPISISSSQTIYVRACDDANNSSTESFTYTIDTEAPSTPVASPIAGLFNSTQSVTLSAVGSDFIEYDLSSLPADCSSGTSYRGSIPVSSSQTIYVRACDNAGNSSTESFTYTIDTEAPSTPIATPSTGVYNSTQSVTLSSTGSDYIKYGASLPSSCGEGTLYDVNPIEVSSSQTIYVRACDDAGNSTITSFAYIIDTEAPSTVIASPVAGTYSSTQSVTLTAEGSDTIQYSTTGIPATCSSDTLYTDPIEVSSSQTIYVRVCDNIGNSSVTNFAYIISKPHYKSIGTTLAYRTNFFATQQALYNPSTAYTLCEPGALFSPTTGKPCTAYTSSSGGGSTFTRTLKLTSPRMTGNDVKDLQTYLNTHGYDVGTADGIFGNKTKSAVIAFQTANNLTPDGAVGPLTRGEMNK